MEQNDTKPNHLERMDAEFKLIPSKSAFFGPAISRPAGGAKIARENFLGRRHARNRIRA